MFDFQHWASPLVLTASRNQRYVVMDQFSLSPFSIKINWPNLVRVPAYGLCRRRLPGVGECRCMPANCRAIAPRRLRALPESFAYRLWYTSGPGARVVIAWNDLVPADISTAAGR
jgi:hypothetical protein